MPAIPTGSPDPRPSWWYQTTKVPSRKAGKVTRPYSRCACACMGEGLCSVAAGVEGDAQMRQDAVRCAARKPKKPAPAATGAWVARAAKMIAPLENKIGENIPYSIGNGLKECFFS